MSRQEIIAWAEARGLPSPYVGCSPSEFRDSVLALMAYMMKLADELEGARPTN